MAAGSLSRCPQRCPAGKATPPVPWQRGGALRAPPPGANKVVAIEEQGAPPPPPPAPIPFLCVASFSLRQGGKMAAGATDGVAGEGSGGGAYRGAGPARRARGGAGGGGCEGVG